MTKLTRHDIAKLATWSDDQLRAHFEQIGTQACHRIKSGPSKGIVKIRFAKSGDMVLAELARRAEANR
jgi:hypothetical protein